jgi:hypothetical protein
VKRRDTTDRVVFAAVLAGILGAGFVWWIARDPLSTAQPVSDDPKALRAAYEALETVGMALERHRQDHGDYPGTLASLVPNYLKQLPPDPFQPSTTLGYASPPGNPSGRILYSFGPDRLDQGGSPLDPVTGKGDLPYPVR